LNVIATESLGKEASGSNNPVAKTILLVDGDQYGEPWSTRHYGYPLFHRRLTPSYRGEEEGKIVKGLTLTFVIEGVGGLIKLSF
jgi:hypothetical protein